MTDKPPETTSQDAPEQGRVVAGPGWTPGPWHDEHPDAHTHQVRDADGKYICGCSQDSQGKARANAGLIAAAPELYDALIAVLRWAATRYGYAVDEAVLLLKPLTEEILFSIDGTKPVQPFVMAHAALTKARGEA